MNEPAGPLHPEYVAHRLRRLYQLMSQRIDDALKPHGVARTQWQVLARLQRAGTLTQKQLQQGMRIESATLTCIVDALAGKGWLERSDSAEDRRVRVLSLTPSGRERLAKIPDPYIGLEERMLEGVPPQSAARVKKALDTMIGNLENWS